LSTEEDILDFYSKQDWGKIAKQLTSFVISYMNYCTKKKYKEWNFPKGNRAEDIAQQAITLVLSGIRKWNTAEYSDFLRYMQFSVCRSLISNLYSSKEEQTTEKLNPSDYFFSSDDESSQVNDGRVVGFDVHYEEIIDNKKFIQELEKGLNGDDTGQLVLLAMIDGNANREIASDLGIPIHEVTNAKKRIQRAAEKIIPSK
jgi:DNA-directed RNA polymerase specialized sigma24 family protein